MLDGLAWKLLRLSSINQNRTKRQSFFLGIELFGIE